MAQIPGTPEIIIKYAMYSRLPGMGCIRGHYSRIFFKKEKVYVRAKIMRERVSMGEAPMTRADAMDYIERHGFVRLHSIEDATLWGSPDEDFKAYAKENGIAVPEGLGMHTLCEHSKTSEDYE